MTKPNCQPESATDAELLGKFARGRSESAFTELVERYLGLVLGVARRRVGNVSMAEDIAQATFAILARKAAGLKATPTIAGWLYRVTMVECTAAIRRPRDQESKMKTITEQVRLEADGDSVWREKLPHLDEAIDDLSPGDRDLVLMRFWEKKSFREIGKALGKSETASQKQAERALEKLGSSLSRRGATISVAVLTAGLDTSLATAAPSVLAATISQSALAAAPALTTTTLILKSIEAMTYAKTKTALAVAVIAAVPIGAQWNANKALQARLTHLESQQNVQAIETNKSVGMRTKSTRTARGATDQASREMRSVPENLPMNVAAEWRKALANVDPLQRSLSIGKLLAGLTPENALEIADVFATAHKTGARYTSEHMMFIRAWGAIDGSAALQHAVDTNGKTDGSPIVLAAMAGWASANPLAARDWAEALPDGQDKEDILFGVLDGWATLDLEAASRYIESRPRTQARNRTRQLLLERALMTGGIPGARDWFGKIDGEGQNKMYKQLAFDELATRMLDHDPQATALWIKEQDGDKHLAGRAIRSTARKLATGNPEDALQFVGSLENMKAGQVTGSFSDIINEWAQADPGAAGGWLNEHPDHPRHDVMVNRYITTISDIEPETALQWAGTIEEENRRRNSQMVAAAGLLAIEGDGAIPKLLEAGLTKSMIKAAPQHARLMKQYAGQERMQSIMSVGEGTVTFGARPVEE